MITHGIFPDVVIEDEHGSKFYKQPQEATAWLAQFMGNRVVGHQWESHAFPGGYEIHYITADGGVLCRHCANENIELTVEYDEQWRIVARDTNYEDDDCYCDNCNRKIQPAYGENK